MKGLEFINQIRAQGRYSFTVQDAERALGLKKPLVLNILRRLKQNKNIVSPAKGFYLVLPPEYQVYGCLPADMFVPDLMKYLNQPYYVGYLSAAQFYGAAHQKPQRFQVVTIKNRLPIKCGRVYIEFIANKNIENIPVKKFNTLAGSIAVATPEVLAVDLVTAPHHAAGVNNMVTILMELVESIDVRNLIELVKVNQEVFWMQRLGYLLEFLGISELADQLAKILLRKRLNWTRLVAHAPYKPLIRDKKWKVIVNTRIEVDE